MQELLEAPAGGTQRRGKRQFTNRHHCKIGFFPTLSLLPGAAIFGAQSTPFYRPLLDNCSLPGIIFFPPYPYSHMRDYTLAKLNETTLPVIQCASRAILFRRPPSYSYSAATSEVRSWAAIQKNACLEEVM